MMVAFSFTDSNVIESLCAKTNLIHKMICTKFWILIFFLRKVYWKPKCNDSANSRFFEFKNTIAR